MSESAEACAECKAPIAAAPPPSPRVAKGEAIAGGGELCTLCRRMKQWGEARASLPRGLDTDAELLLATLELAVPVRISALSRRSLDYVLDKERCSRLSDVIAYEGRHHAVSE